MLSFLCPRIRLLYATVIYSLCCFMHLFRMPEGGLSLGGPSYTKTSAEPRMPGDVDVVMWKAHGYAQPWAGRTMGLHAP